jgi:hypothetical protein
MSNVNTNVNANLTIYITVSTPQAEPRSLFGIIDQKEEFGFVLPKSGLIWIIFLSPGANFPARILSFLLCFSVYAVACRRTASNARIANLRRDSARRS